MLIVKRNNVQTAIKEDFYTQDIEEQKDRTGGKQRRGEKRESDINFQCPLTLQRFVVKQSKLRLFQKALFEEDFRKFTSHWRCRNVFECN